MQNLQDQKIDIKIKLAGIWTSFMLLYLYVDYFALYMPNKIDGILQGKVFVFDITPSFIFTALALATIPIAMIFLSLLLPAKINRNTQIVVAILHIPYMLLNLVGEFWPHMVFAAVVEVMMLVLIIHTAYNWPRTAI